MYPDLQVHVHFYMCEPNDSYRIPLQIQGDRGVNTIQARSFIEGYTSFPASTVSAVLVTDLATGASAGGVDITEVRCDPRPATR